MKIFLIIFGFALNHLITNAAPFKLDLTNNKGTLINNDQNTNDQILDISTNNKKLFKDDEQISNLLNKFSKNPIESHLQPNEVDNVKNLFSVPKINRFTKLYTFIPELIENSSQSTNHIEELNSNLTNSGTIEQLNELKFNNSIGFISKFFSDFAENQNFDDAIFTALNESNNYLEILIVSKIKSQVQLYSPELYQFVQYESDLISLTNVLAPKLEYAFNEYLIENGLSELNPFINNFINVLMQTLSFNEAYECAKKDFNMTIFQSIIQARVQKYLEDQLVIKVKEWIRLYLPSLYDLISNETELTSIYSILDFVFTDYLTSNGFPDLKPKIDDFIQTLVKTGNLREALRCIESDIDPILEYLIVERVKSYVQSFDAKAYDLILNETKLSNIVSQLFTYGKFILEQKSEELNLNGIIGIIEKFYDSYLNNFNFLEAYDCIYADLAVLIEKKIIAEIKSFFFDYSLNIYTMIKDLNDLQSVSDVLCQVIEYVVKDQIGNSGFAELAAIISNFTDAYMNRNMDFAECFNAISNDLISFLETQCVFQLKLIVQNYSTALYELLKDETDLSTIIEMLLPISEIVIQIKFNEFGLNEVFIILKKFYDSFKETLEFSDALNCIYPDVLILIERKIESFIKYFLISYSPSIYQIIKDLDNLNGLNDNVGRIIDALINDISLSSNYAALSAILIKLKRLYEETKCLEDALLLILSDVGIFLENCIINTIEEWLQRLGIFIQFFIDELNNLNIFNWMESIFNFCFDNLKIDKLGKVI